MEHLQLDGIRESQCVFTVGILTNQLTVELLSKKYFPHPTTFLAPLKKDRQSRKAYSH